jgi:hypothetical protein
MDVPLPTLYFEASIEKIASHASAGLAIMLPCRKRGQD